MKRIGWTLAAAGLALVGVGCSARPASTPQAVFEAVQKAFGTGDYGVVYDSMSNSAQAEFATSVKDMAEKSKDMPPFAKQLLGFDPASLAALPPREAFISMMKNLRQAEEKLGKALGGVKASEPVVGSKLKACEIQGERATLTVEYADGSTSKLEMVLEGGRWKFATNLGGKR